MARIDILFGSPTSEKALNGNEQWAFNHEVSMESANIGSFNSVMGVLIKANDEGRSYFDLSFTCITGLDVLCPKITYSTYQFNKSKYPKLSIHGDYLVDRDSNEEIFIVDDWVERIGKYVEEDFDYEFVEFKRIGKVKMNKNEIIYLIGEKPHLHHNGKFLPIKTK